MSVTGGRPPWARVGSCSSVVGLALLLVAACGGRTSQLDQDAFDPDQNPFTDPNGGSAHGGSSGSPKAGGATAGNGSSNPGLEISVCQDYCSGYAQKCPSRLMGRECQSACAAEMTGFGPKCEDLGLAALKCLTPFFKRPDLSCDVAVNQALTQCRAQVDRFEDCKGVDDPPPKPQPNPNPPQPQPNPPQPNPTPTPAFCGGMGTATFDYCYVAYSCPEGLYTTTCAVIAGNAAYNCSCSSPNGLTQGFTLGGMAPPCDYASEVCGFSPAILK